MQLISAKKIKTFWAEKNPVQTAYYCRRHCFPKWKRFFVGRLKCLFKSRRIPVHLRFMKEYGVESVYGYSQFSSFQIHTSLWLFLSFLNGIWLAKTFDIKNSTRIPSVRKADSRWLDLHIFSLLHLHFLTCKQKLDTFYDDCTTWKDNPKWNLMQKYGNIFLQRRGAAVITMCEMGQK